MMWLLLFMGSLSLVLIVKNVQPVWTQHLAFGTSLAVLCMYIFSSLKINTGKFGSWCRKKGFKWVVVFLLGLVIFVSKKYEIIIDYSQASLYSLRSSTIEWISKFNVPVTITIFTESDDQTHSRGDWLQEQISKNTEKVTVEIKNLNREVFLVKKYGITKSGETVLTTGDFWVKIDTFQEQDLVMGLMRLLSRSDATLCFLAGHGEPDISDQNQSGLFGLSGYLQSLGYKVKTVELETKAEETQTLDKICGALFILSPKTAFLDSEKMVLSTLMKTDLPMFMGLDLPVTKAVVDLLADEGLVLSAHVIMNKNNLVQKIPVTDLLVYSKNIDSILNNSIKKKVYQPNVQALEIKETSPQGFSYLSAIEVVANEGYSLLADETAPGPFIIAAAAAKGKKPLRVIFGSGDWLRTKNLDYGDNRQLILGTVRWILAESQIGQTDSQLSLPDPKYMEISEEEHWWVKVLSMYLIPASVGFLCFVYWFQRRVRS